MKKSIVTVIVVCFNEERKKIRQTLMSILYQTYENMELVVIDGGSNLETVKAFDEFMPFIDIFVSEPDKGIYDAMNKGVCCSSGDWLCFLNVGDCFSSVHVLETVMSNTDQADILYGEVVRQDGKVTKKAPRNINKYMLYSSYFCHQSMFFHSCLFQKNGLHNLKYRLVSDREWIYRAYDMGAKFKYVPVVVCDYEGGGVSANYDKVTKELNEMRKRLFVFPERVVFRILLTLEKVYIRIVTKNLSLPMSIKRLFNS